MLDACYSVTITIHYTKAIMEHMSAIFAARLYQVVISATLLLLATVVRKDILCLVILAL